MLASLLAKASNTTHIDDVVVWSASSSLHHNTEKGRVSTLPAFYLSAKKASISAFFACTLPCWK
ncbi:MAG: hypothetical protein IIW27_00235, partial [Clostridia bacterium]|nr:hypothetical protein [Clostridia bacterium]